MDKPPVSVTLGMDKLFELITTIYLNESRARLAIKDTEAAIRVKMLMRASETPIKPRSNPANTGTG